ncbi:DUF6193 family natural product biosynthesis protein [Streptomyces sp. NPDC047990]|uniref:DUF6193 family natural product biosynthesis protein n=1 Tax=Streptomyces sp. NPDC047990 TaxID=3365496 RepID=UPI0037241ADA
MRVDQPLPRTREQEWNVILDEYRPPHAANSFATQEMWELLSTAFRNATFRSLYPTISMWSLTVSDADSISDIKDELPAVSAASGEYRVLAWPYRGDEYLYLTSDPTEAVEFAADLIKDRQTSKD